jgi:hypothetical protein
LQAVECRLGGWKRGKPISKKRKIEILTGSSRGEGEMAAAKGSSFSL